MRARNQLPKQYTIEINSIHVSTINFLRNIITTNITGYKKHYILGNNLDIKSKFGLHIFLNLYWSWEGNKQLINIFLTKNILIKHTCVIYVERGIHYSVPRDYGVIVISKINLTFKYLKYLIKYTITNTITYSRHYINI